MNMIKRIPEQIIKQAFHFSVWLIERFHDMKVYEEKVERLRCLPKGTLGRAIAECLDQHHLRLVPGFESHDLKHTLLDYDMTPLDEIRLQAFMIGNGNVTLPSIAIFTFGFVLLPNKWLQFARDFRRGLHSRAIKDWRIEDYAERDLLPLRQDVVLSQPRFDWSRLLEKAVLFGSVFSMLAGGFGMIYCLPYLFSPVLEDLVGAGFPFLGGAVLFAAGLMSLGRELRSIAMNRPSTA